MTRCLVGGALQHQVSEDPLLPHCFSANGRGIMQESMSSLQLHSEHILPLKRGMGGGNAPMCFPCSCICNVLAPGEQTHLHKCHRWIHTRTHTATLASSEVCVNLFDVLPLFVATRWWLMQKKKPHSGIVLFMWFPLKCGLSHCRGCNAPVPVKKTPPLI